VRREITKTKTSESVKSTLYTVADDNFLQPIYTKDVLSDTDTIDSLCPISARERLDAKNDKDVQAMLDLLIPPYEVYTSTQFLLQDSINIFELAPKDRLIVFKHIF
jgi:hypothetical protein